MTKCGTMNSSYSFLEKLGLMVEVVKLPDAWRNELNDLQNLIDDEAG